MKKILTNSLDEVTALINEYEMLKSISSSCKHGLLNIHGMQTKNLDKTTHAMYVLMDLAVRDWEKEIERRSIKKTFYTEQELIQILQGLTQTFAELQRHNISYWCICILPRWLIIFNFYSLVSFFCIAFFI